MIAGVASGIIPVTESLFNLYPDCIVESVNWIPFTPLFRKINRLNNKRFARSILKAIDQLGFKDYLLINDSEMFKAFHLKEFLNPVLSAYYSRDNLMGVNYWRRHGLQLEPELIAKSDLCLANSEYLRAYCGKYNPDSYYVGQGCDFTSFNEAPRAVPGEMQGIPKPIIGYVGALWTTRLDLPLLESIADKRKDWSFVFVGPEDEHFQRSRLHHMSNVHFSGAKKPEMLATYISAFDVCMNPQYVNPITIGNYPRKIDEYLAMGKPTIATLTESMLYFKDYVALANNEQEYIDGIERLLATDGAGLQRDRRTFALSHSWENSVELMAQAFAKVAVQKGKIL